MRQSNLLLATPRRDTGLSHSGGVVGWSGGLDYNYSDFAVTITTHMSPVAKHRNLCHMRLGFNLILVLRTVFLGMFVMRGHAFRITRAAGHRILSLKCAAARKFTVETPDGGRLPLGGPELSPADTDIDNQVSLVKREVWDIAMLAGWLHGCDLTVRKADKYARLLYCDHNVANERALGRRVGRDGRFLAQAGVAAEDAEGIQGRLQQQGLVAQWREAPEGTGQRIWDAAKTGDMAALGGLVQEWSGNEVLNWANRDECFDEDDDCHGSSTPLMICSREGMVGAVRLLLAASGERPHAVPAYTYPISTHYPLSSTPPKASMSTSRMITTSRLSAWQLKMTTPRS